MIYQEKEDAIRERIAELQESLRTKNPKEISDQAHVGYDPGSKNLFFLSMGKEVLVTTPEFDVKTDDPEYSLLVLEYLNRADGTAVSGEERSVSELLEEEKSEEMEQRMEDTFDGYFAGAKADHFLKGIKKFGAVLYESDADVTATFWMFPQLPLTVYFWEETEECMASGDIQADETGIHYLSPEEICRAGILALKRLRQILNEKKEKKEKKIPQGKE